LDPREEVGVVVAFNDIDTDILARIQARMSACFSACHRNNVRKMRVGRVGEDPRDDVGVV